MFYNDDLDLSPETTELRFMNTMKSVHFICNTLAWFLVWFSADFELLANAPSNVGLEMMDDRAFVRAAEYFESAVEIAPSRSEAQEIHHVLGYCYEQLEKWEQAFEHFELATAPEYILADYAIYRLARGYTKNEDHRAALSWYNRLVDRYPESFLRSRVQYEIVRTYLKQEDYSNALKYAAELLKNKQGVYARKTSYEQAKAFEGVENWEEAICTYQSIIDLDASDDLARKAFEQIKKLVKVHPNIEITRGQRMVHGMVLYHHGRFKDAITAFQEVAINKKDRLTGRAIYYLGRAYHRQRKYDLAIQEYNKISASYSDSRYLTRALYQTTICYRRKAQPDIAQKLLQDFVKDYSWSEYADNALYDLGWVLENEGHFDAAIKSYSQLPGRYSRSRLASDAYWRIGWIQFKNEQYDKSIDTFASLISLFPGNRLAMAAHFWTAKCWERKGQQELSERVYREVAGSDHWYYSSRAEAVLNRLGKRPQIVNSSSKYSPVKMGSKHSRWKDASSNRFPRVEKLLQLRLYEDAITELRGEIRLERTDLTDSYYNLIVCYQNQRKFKRAYDSAGVLSEKITMRDGNQEIPLELSQLLYPFYYAEIIDKYSEKYEIDRLFVASMILEESHYGAEVISWAGALGLMQIMPQTGRELARELKIGHFHNAMLFDPEINIEMGTKYMKSLMDRFEGNHALVVGAYNAGPARMGRWVKEMGISDLDEFIEDISINETRRHIKKVLHSYHVYQKLYASKSNVRDINPPKSRNGVDNAANGK